MFFYQKNSISHTNKYSMQKLILRTAEYIVTALKCLNSYLMLITVHFYLFCFKSLASYGEWLQLMAATGAKRF
jgi:hypothetical protein